MKKISAKLLVAGLLAAAMTPAYGGAEFKLGDDAGLTAGIGLRVSYSHRERGAPNGTDDANDFAVENARLFFGGHYGKVIKGTFNTERQGGPAATGGDSIRVMDAIAQFEFKPEFNVWLGRMLPPSDRANLYGPFFGLPWSYPGAASNYPNLAVGRDNGAMVWGKPLGGLAVWAGQSATKLLYAGRLAFNIWDPGACAGPLHRRLVRRAKDILTVALAGFTQQDGVGTAASPGKLRIWNADCAVREESSAPVCRPWSLLTTNTTSAPWTAAPVSPERPLAPSATT